MTHLHRAISLAREWDRVDAASLLIFPAVALLFVALVGLTA